jgi:hypothetical protein
MLDAPRPTPAGSSIVVARRPWTLPTLRELPKLTALTLASAIGGAGGTGGGGSTVFGFLLAIGLVTSACSADQMTEPASGGMPNAVASIPCVGDVAAKTIRCGSLQAAPGQEILGRQGVLVLLESADVHYLGTDFTFIASVRNLSDQVIGSDGAGATDVRVFFVSTPLATGGSGAITVEDDSVGTFTAPGQAYYKYPGSLAPGATSPWVAWRFSIPATVTTFTFQVLVAADVIDQGGAFRWRPINGLTQRRYNAVAGWSPSDRMAVGDSGVTAHWDGSTWTAIPGFVPENITAVTAVGPGEYYAATERGAVLHFAINSWREIYRRADLGAFSDIWAGTEFNIVAIGLGGRISSTLRGGWADDDILAETPGSGDGLVAVSGDTSGLTSRAPVSLLNNNAGTAEVWIWNDGPGGWIIDPSFPVIHGLGHDLVYDGAGQTLVAFTVGTPFDSTGFVMNSTGDLLTVGHFRPQTLLPTGTDRVAVGGWEYGSGGARFIEQIDYSSLPASSTPLTTDLGSDIGHIAATNAAGTQFVVTSADQHLSQWDGGVWVDVQGSDHGTDASLWGVGDTVWLLDGIGSLTRIVNGVPSASLDHPGLHQLWGSSSSIFPGSPSTTFVSFDATGARYSDGVTGWGPLFDFAEDPVARGIWADPTASMVILVGTKGSQGYVGSFQVGVSLSEQVITDHGNAVWGCDPGLAWIVTEEGTIHAWSFGSESPYSPFTGSPTPLRVITGTSCTDVWVGGDGGAMYHWDGNVWNDLSHSSPGQRWNAIIPRGAGEVMVAGTAGVAAIYMADGGYHEIQLPTQGKDVTALWRLANGEIYAAGANLLLRGTR